MSVPTQFTSPRPTYPLQLPLRYGHNFATPKDAGKSAARSSYVQQDQWVKWLTDAEVLRNQLAILLENGETRNISSVEYHSQVAQIATNYVALWVNIATLLQRYDMQCTLVPAPPRHQKPKPKQLAPTAPAHANDAQESDGVDLDEGRYFEWRGSASLAYCVKSSTMQRYKIRVQRDTCMRFETIMALVATAIAYLNLASALQTEAYESRDPVDHTQFVAKAIVRAHALVRLAHKEAHSFPLRYNIDGTLVELNTRVLQGLQHWCAYRVQFVQLRQLEQKMVTRTATHSPEDLQRKMLCAMRGAMDSATFAYAGFNIHESSVPLSSAAAIAHVERQLMYCNILLCKSVQLESGVRMLRESNPLLAYDGDDASACDASGASAADNTPQLHRGRVLLSSAHQTTVCAMHTVATTRKLVSRLPKDVAKWYEKILAGLWQSMYKISENIAEHATATQTTLASCNDCVSSQNDLIPLFAQEPSTSISPEFFEQQLRDLQQQMGTLGKSEALNIPSGTAGTGPMSVMPTIAVTPLVSLFNEIQRRAADVPHAPEKPVQSKAFVIATLCQEQQLHSSAAIVQEDGPPVGNLGDDVHADAHSTTDATVTPQEEPVVLPEPDENVQSDLQSLLLQNLLPSVPKHDSLQDTSVQLLS